MKTPQEYIEEFDAIKYESSYLNGIYQGALEMHKIIMEIIEDSMINAFSFRHYMGLNVLKERLQLHNPENKNKSSHLGKTEKTGSRDSLRGCGKTVHHLYRPENNRIEGIIKCGYDDLTRAYIILCPECKDKQEVKDEKELLS